MNDNNTYSDNEAFVDEDTYLKKIGKEKDGETGNVLENVPDKPSMKKISVD